MAPVNLDTRALLSAAATHLYPTRTLPLLLHLHPRQQSSSTSSAAATTITVVSVSGSSNSDDSSNNAPNGNPSPTSTTGLTGGAIAGIVIGSIAGFLLLVWIIRSCTNLGAPPGEEAVPGRPWYGSVRDEGPYPPGPAGPVRTSRRRERERRGRSRGRSRGYDEYDEDVVYERRSRSGGAGGGGGRRSRSRRVSEVVEVPVVQEVAPVRVRQSRSPGGRVYYGEGPVRGSRSRSRSGY